MKALPGFRPPERTGILKSRRTAAQHAPRFYLLSALIEAANSVPASPEGTSFFSLHSGVTTSSSFLKKEVLIVLCVILANELNVSDFPKCCFLKFSASVQAPLSLYWHYSKFANQVRRVFVDDDVEKKKRNALSRSS